MSKLRDQFDQNNVAKITERDIIRKAKDRGCYAITFDQAGRHPISVAIDLITLGGNRLGIFYMEITSPIQFHLGTGTSPQTISLQTSTLEITISGKGLIPIYEYLLEQRLVWLKELDASFPLDTNATVIQSIQVSGDSCSLK